MSSRSSLYDPWRLRNNRRQVHGSGSKDSIKSAATAVTQSAHEIFSNGDMCSTRRTGIVDGEEMTFELLENVTKVRPQTSREERQKFDCSLINHEPSPWGLRARWWTLKLKVRTVTILYVGSFLALNFVFAGLWFIKDNKCCENPDHSYLEIFDFAIQTSTTIGYGGYVPDGIWSNFLVVVISILALVLTSIYAGLLVTKFVRPEAKIRFSEVMTLSNVNGVPVLEIRVGNADGNNNLLLNVEVRMTYSFMVDYIDERGENRTLGQTEQLKLLCDRRPLLDSFVWTLRHMVDEKSPLFGLDLLTPPGSQISDITVTLQATQKITGGMVFSHAGYQIEDIMIGHRFADQLSIDREKRAGICDHAKFDETVPQPVWYPAIPTETAKARITPVRRLGSMEEQTANA